ncbi:MAG TPA: imidazolonepropionase [Flavobacteriales bacterium]|nr:imidazolonepropionase [Flavobacteriales bacterium]|tara:strand:+ start:21 stop:1268 length:1248 start_codon:yes stop_codon:yes gene_type:complete
MKTVIKNIFKLVQVEHQIRKWVSGSEMSKIDTIKDGFIEIQDGIITAFGSMDQWTGIDNWNNTEIIDANGGMVFPSYCDSHTHLVFAGNRENEWEQRIKGASYEDIAKNGGGILNSAKKLQETSEDELLEKALQRAKEVMKMGTGAIEIKSGYGLTTEAELKMLRVIKRLKKLSPLTIKATFLGAHAIPQEYKTNKSAYLDLIINEMLPQIAQEQLAEYIDIFCEEGYFSLEDTERLLEAAQSYDLIPKTHVNQFTILGGVKASVKYKALSVDHLEIMNNEDIEALKGSECMPTLLPSCSFFLGIPYGPAKKLMENDLPVALATDYNPGSSPSGNMNFVASLGCIRMGMTPEEVINATTINTAYAMGLSQELGSIAVGKKANLFITKPITSYTFIPYSFGHQYIDKIIINGKVQS